MGDVSAWLVCGWQTGRPAGLTPNASGLFGQLASDKRSPRRDKTFCNGALASLLRHFILMI